MMPQLCDAGIGAGPGSLWSGSTLWIVGIHRAAAFTESWKALANAEFWTTFLIKQFRQAR